MRKVIDLTGKKEGFEFLSTTGEVFLSDLIQGTSGWMLGSTIQVEEILTLTTFMADPDVVSRDYTWYPAKIYAGSWRLFEREGFYIATEGDEGFITAENYKIKRYSTYTIGIGGNQTLVTTGGGKIGACNAYLLPEVYLFPNEINPRPGFRFIDKEPQFIFDSNEQSAPLRDRKIPQKIGGAGIYLKPGMEAKGAMYEIKAINLIESDFPNFPVPNCTFLAPNCEQQFQSFLIIKNTDEGAAIAYQQTLSGQTVILAETFVCPTDANVSFPYWTVTIINV